MSSPRPAPEPDSGSLTYDAPTPGAGGFSDHPSNFEGQYIGGWMPASASPSESSIGQAPTPGPPPSPPLTRPRWEHQYRGGRGSSVDDEEGEEDESVGSSSGLNDADDEMSTWNVSGWEGSSGHGGSRPERSSEEGSGRASENMSEGADTRSSGKTSEEDDDDDDDDEEEGEEGEEEEDDIDSEDEDKESGNASAAGRERGRTFERLNRSLIKKR